jgi:TonB family protein
MDARTTRAYDGLAMFDIKSVYSTRIVGAALVAAACSTQPTPQAPGSDPEGQAPPAASESTGSPEPAAASTGESAPVLAPSAQPGEPATSDTRSKAEIQRIVADNRHKVRACYDAALATNPGIQGDLVVSFVIAPDGTVKQAEVNWSESELHVPELDTCAVDAIKTLQFPASSRGLESKVNFPFNFNPQPTTPKSAAPKP